MGDHYLEQPLLKIHDADAYAPALAGWDVAVTAALLRYGLIPNDQAQPMPSTVALIALAS